MSFRDWLIILGVLAVVLIIADGFRRVWLHRRRANELNFGLENIKWQDDEFSSELPNGGARTANQDLANDNDQSGGIDFSDDKRLEPFISDIPQSSPKNQFTDTRDGSEGETEEVVSAARALELDSTASDEVPDIDVKGQQSLDLEQPVPVLMDVDDKRPDVTVSDPVTITADSNADFPSPPEVMSAIVPEKQEPDFSDPRGDGVLKQVEEVLIINLTARKGETFAGSDLFDLFMSEGLRFGNMNIFHRHIQPDGRGDTLFSVASGVEPGTFNLKTMENDTTPALSFFMGLPGPEGSESMQAFRIMVEAVYHIAEELGAVLKDERHSVLTQQTLEHYRQRISDFERRRMTHRRNNKARV